MAEWRRYFISWSERAGELRYVNGRPHGRYWHPCWTVEVEFNSEEDAKAFVREHLAPVEKEKAPEA